MSAMGVMATVKAWDTSLRACDWDAARALLADDAIYASVDEPDAPPRTMCGGPDEIVGMMRGWKGKLPDVEVVAWEQLGDQVLAQLRQPAWGEDTDWYQVLSVTDDRIARLTDFPTKGAALATMVEPG